MASEREQFANQERRKQGAERNALDTSESNEIKLGIRKRIKEALAQGEATLTFSRDAAQMAGLFTEGFARRLRAMRTPQAPNGYLLTFHQRQPRAGEEVTLEDDVRDEAGIPYPAVTDPFPAKNQKPLNPEEILVAKIRRLPHALGEAIPADAEIISARTEAGELGFGDTERGLLRTSTMVSVRKTRGGEWSEVSLLPYSEIAISPNAQILHYGGGFFEGMTAEWGADGKCYVFGLDQHWERMRRGALSLGVDIIPFEIFKEAILKVIQQNALFIPPCGKGRLYVRPHAGDYGAQMRVGNSGDTSFFVEVTPIGSADSYFGRTEYDENGSVIGQGLAIPTAKLRSAPGLSGKNKAIGNYGATPPIIRGALSLNVGNEGNPRRPVGVLFVDRKTQGLDPEAMLDAEVRETNASNTLFFEDLGDDRYRVVTPTLETGDILPGNTRALLLEIAKTYGWEVEERTVTVREIKSGKFIAAANCGTAAVLSPFDWIHFARIEENADHWESELVGEIIPIRSQEAINNNPIPIPISRLLEDMLKIKSGRNPEYASYLTAVPGITRAAV